MTIKIIFERSRVQRGVGRGFEKRVNSGPTLKFYCRPKAQEKQNFGKSHFYCRRFFPRKYSDNNFEQLPPFHPPGGRTMGPYKCENYCRREFLSFRRLLDMIFLYFPGSGYLP